MITSGCAHVWRTACNKATKAVREALGEVGQKAHLLRCSTLLPIEVKIRLQWVTTRALSEGYNQVQWMKGWTCSRGR